MSIVDTFVRTQPCIDEKMRRLLRIFSVLHVLYMGHRLFGRYNNTIALCSHHAVCNAPGTYVGLRATGVHECKSLSAEAEHCCFPIRAPKDYP